MKARRLAEWLMAWLVFAPAYVLVWMVIAIMDWMDGMDEMDPVDGGKCDSMDREWRE